MSDAPGINLVTTLLRQVIAEQAATRDDMRVLTAIAKRQDNTLAALLTEVRAMHSQHSRMDSRLRALEATTANE
jgi:hypothetical protein